MNGTVTMMLSDYDILIDVKRSLEDEVKALKAEMAKQVAFAQELLEVHTNLEVEYMHARFSYYFEWDAELKTHVVKEWNMRYLSQFSQEAIQRYIDTLTAQKLDALAFEVEKK